jgi:hypothetical protein
MVVAVRAMGVCFSEGGYRKSVQTGTERDLINMLAHFRELRPYEDEYARRHWGNYDNDTRFVRDLHDRVVVDYNRLITVEVNARVARQRQAAEARLQADRKESLKRASPSTFGTWPKGWAIPEWARLLDSPLDLVKEGIEMHHCVGSYETTCRQGRSFVFAVDKDGERATLELVRYLLPEVGLATRAPVEKLVVRQFFAVKNGPVSAALRELATTWAAALPTHELPPPQHLRGSLDVLLQ